MFAFSAARRVASATLHRAFSAWHAHPPPLRSSSSSVFAALSTATVAATVTTAVVMLPLKKKEEEEEEDKQEEALLWKNTENRRGMQFVCSSRLFAATPTPAEDPQVPATVLQAKLRAIFDKFASVVKDGERFMTPEDFVRSLTQEAADPDSPDAPSYLQDSQLHVLFNRVVDREKSGLVSFDDYRLLFEMLTTPQSAFQLAFQMFDTQKRGIITKEEFKKVLQQAGHTHFNFDCELMKRWFGADGKGQLSYAQFSQFLKSLQEELQKQEFQAYDKDKDGYISGADFARLVDATLESSRVPARVRKNLENLSQSLQEGRISYPEYVTFNAMMRQLDMVVAGLKAAAAANEKGMIGKTDFAAAVRSSTGLALSPLEVDIIFWLFDDNRDGLLTPDEYSELLQMSAHRQQRGLSVSEWLRSGGQALSPEDLAGGKKATEEAPKSFGQRFVAAAVVALKSFVMGGIAGAIGATAVYPIDLVKTRMQNQRRGRVAAGAPRYNSSIDCFVKTYRGEGFKGLYRGLGPQLVGVAPEKAIKLVVNDFLRSAFKRPDQTDYLPLEILAGGGAGAAQVIFTNPLEIVKIRLQVQGELAKQGIAPKSAMTIVRELGFLGLYKGAGACLLRDFPFSAIYFPLYAKTRSYLANRGRTAEEIRTSPNKPKPQHLLLAGSFAGVFAASLTTPADVIKTRLQVEPVSGPPYKNIRDAALRIWREEGITAFFKGVTPRIVRSSPQFGVTLLAYELLQNFFASDPDVPRPLGVMAGGAAASEEDYKIMRELVVRNLDKLQRFGIHATRRPTPPPAPPAVESAPASSSSSESAQSSAPAAVPAPQPQKSRDRSLSGGY